MEENKTPLELLQSRHSVRAYSLDPIPQKILNTLKATVTMINTHEQGLKFQVITDDPEPFKAFSRSYGSFTNPRNYLAAVVDPAVDDVHERAGYFAEKFVIKAVELGLGTCFVGGTYNSKKVKAQLRAGEEILFIVLFGYPLGKEKLLAKLTSKFAHRKTMAPEDFFIPKMELPQALEEFPDLKIGLEAVACAPSSLNKRPARLSVEWGKGVFAEVPDSNPSTLIDLGIAKFNYNYATSTQCEWGDGAMLSE